MKNCIPNIREREGNEIRHSLNSGTGREWKKTFPKFGNGNQRLLFPGMDENGNGTKKLRWLELIENVVKCSENKGRVPKKTRKNLSQSTIFPFDSRLWNGQFGNGKGMKKSIPKVRERESEASILGNDREREFPLTPESNQMHMVILNDAHWPKCWWIEPSCIRSLRMLHWVTPSTVWKVS